MTDKRCPFEVELASVPQSSGQARDAVRAFVSHANRDEMANDAALIISELVTNAARYAAGTIRVGLSWERDDLRIEVHDTSRAPPAESPPSNTAVRGRGLHIVDALANDWGFDIAPGGKAVWASLHSSA